MAASKNMLENKILRALSVYHALAENKLYSMVRETDEVVDEDRDYTKAIYDLMKKGLIDVVEQGKHSVVRMKQEVYH